MLVYHSVEKEKRRFRKPVIRTGNLCSSKDSALELALSRNVLEPFLPSLSTSLIMFSIRLSSLLLSAWEPSSLVSGTGAGAVTVSGLSVFFNQNMLYGDSGLSRMWFRTTSLPRACQLLRDNLRKCTLFFC